MKTLVYCKLQVEGIHRWLSCPLDEVSYLRDYHRHIFTVACGVEVFHDDRDVEFIVLKHKVQKYLKKNYFDKQQNLHFFGDMSCEMIAQELMDEFNLAWCEVNEDEENGCFITRGTV